jgi:hypothetical protein
LVVVSKKRGVDGQAGPDASGSGVLLEEDRHLCLRGAASRHAQDEFDQLTVRCVDLDAVQRSRSSTTATELPERVSVFLFTIRTG